MRAAKFRFYPTLAQRRQLSKEFGCSRFVYNWALNRKSSLYKADKKNISRFELSAELTQLKNELPWLRNASSTTLAESLEDLDNGFKAFFKKNNRYPRRKKYRRASSVRYNLDKRQKGIFKDGHVLKLPKLGSLNIVWTSEVDSFPLTATISRDNADRWFVSLQFKSNKEFSPPSSVNEIGIDMGIIDLVTTSNGKKVKPIRSYQKNLKRLKKKQRHLSRSKKGSKNRSKKRLRVARAHAKIADQRKDFLHKLSTSIVRENQVIAIEDLSVKSMMSPARKSGQRKLARSIGDCAWRELRTFLEYKSKWYKRELIVIPRFQRSTGVCPECDCRQDLTLADRTWVCKACHTEHDRDIAAAKVILGIARMARTAA